MSFYLELHRATRIRRREDGRPYMWKTCELVEKFNDPLKFVDYVRDNAKKLKNVVAVCGSASRSANTNGLIANELKRAGILK